jgi:hypothetical protein
MVLLESKLHMSEEKLTCRTSPQFRYKQLIWQIVVPRSLGSNKNVVRRRFSKISHRRDGTSNGENGRWATKRGKLSISIMTLTRRVRSFRSRRPKSCSRCDPPEFQRSELRNLGIHNDENEIDGEKVISNITYLVR